MSNAYPNLCHDTQCYNDLLPWIESSWDMNITKNSIKGSDYTADGKR